MSKNFNKDRILKNTLLLYVRMLFTMWLNLYATRLILKNLGVNDLGIYGVVGGIVAMFGVFTNGITNAVQRFISYELGREDGDVNNVFCSSLNIIFLLSVFILLLLESIGLWFLYNKVNIPPDRMDAAFWVFQLSVLTCIITLISVPYNSLIIANEKMNAFAYISICQVILNCAAAYSLSFFRTDRLVAYSILMAAIILFIRIIYQCYCKRKFQEARYKWHIDRNLVAKIGNFAGVSTFSGVLQIIATQGITLVINWTFGVAINAVYSIALQLKNSILSFALNLLKAISPQITKTYANGEYDAFHKLVYSGCKIEAYLIFFIMIPFLFRTEYILELWLGNVPPYTVPFAQCIVFISLSYAAFEPIRAAVMATGQIAKFMLYPYLFYLIVLPVAYILGTITGSPVWMIGGIVLIEILLCLVQIYYASRVTVITMQEWTKRIFLPGLIVALGSSAICYLLTWVTDETIGGLILLVGLNALGLMGVVYVAGLSKGEREMVKGMLVKCCKKIKNIHA